MVSPRVYRSTAMQFKVLDSQWVRTIHASGHEFKVVLYRGADPEVFQLELYRVAGDKVLDMLPTEVDCHTSLHALEADIHHMVGILLGSL
jgi:hypothetical protein